MVLRYMVSSYSILDDLKNCNIDIEKLLKEEITDSEKTDLKYKLSLNSFLLNEYKKSLEELKNIEKVKDKYLYWNIKALEYRF